MLKIQVEQERHEFPIAIWFVVNLCMVSTSSSVRPRNELGVI
jgi:hypothetical protein